jgi:hypothetical protein
MLSKKAGPLLFSSASAAGLVHVLAICFRRIRSNPLCIPALAMSQARAFWHLYATVPLGSRKCLIMLSFDGFLLE